MEHRDHRDENSQTKYLRVSNPAGEFHEVEISTMTLVWAVRLSPGGQVVGGGEPGRSRE